jgi:hypothetical protein
MSLALSFPDGTYTTSNKPSVNTLKLDLTLIESEVNSHEADTTAHVPIGTVLETVYPIGSVFTAVVSTNPATLLGFGTWSQIAQGQFLIGQKGTDTDFDVAEETGGAKTATIAQANLPNISTGAGTAHTHTQDAHTHTQDAHAHYLFADQTVTNTALTNSNYVAHTRNASSDYSYGANGGGTTTAATLGLSSSTTATNQNTTATNQNESTHTHSLGGSGTAMSIMNPYFVVYFWKRTA